MVREMSMQGQPSRLKKEVAFFIITLLTGINGFIQLCDDPLNFIC